MAWYGWILLAVSLYGWIACWRRLSWLLYQDCYKPDAADLSFAIFIGALLGLFWPIILPFYVAQKHGLLTAFMKPPRREREHEQEERIRQLERELGIQ